jgi:hypothetical protein
MYSQINMAVKPLMEQLKRVEIKKDAMVLPKHPLK